MEDYSKFNLAGYYHFSNKDRTKTYYIVQLSTNKEESPSNNKCFIVNVFVDSDTYAEVITKEIGDILNVKVSANFETGKLNYEIVL